MALLQILAATAQRELPDACRSNRATDNPIEWTETVMSGTTPVPIDTYAQLYFRCTRENSLCNRACLSVATTSTPSPWRKRAQNMLPGSLRENICAIRLKALWVRARHQGGRRRRLGPNDFAQLAGARHRIKTARKREMKMLRFQNEESVAWACRAISRCSAVYDDLAPQMGESRKLGWNNGSGKSWDAR